MRCMGGVGVRGSGEDAAGQKGGLHELGYIHVQVRGRREEFGEKLEHPPPVPRLSALVRREVLGKASIRGLRFLLSEGEGMEVNGVGGSGYHEKPKSHYLSLTIQQK